jgi:hypothetical protein
VYGVGDVLVHPTIAPEDPFAIRIITFKWVDAGNGLIFQPPFPSFSILTVLVAQRLPTYPEGGASGPGGANRR